MPPADGSQTSLALRPAQRQSWDLSCTECGEPEGVDDDGFCEACASDLAPSESYLRKWEGTYG